MLQFVSAKVFIYSWLSDLYFHVKYRNAESSGAKEVAAPSTGGGL